MSRLFFTIIHRLQTMVGARQAWLTVGTVIAAGPLLGAWFLSSVFQRSWTAIALILLAMLVITLLRRMLIGAIPEPELPRRDEQHESAGPRELAKIEAELPGIDRRYGWMALPSVMAFALIVASMLVW